MYPTLHTQLFKSVLPAAELEFPGQVVQVAEPVVFLYIDTQHAVHGQTFGPVYPVDNLRCNCKNK